MCGGPQASLTQLRKNCKDHERLLAALRARDANSAEREARTHVRQLAAVVADSEPRRASKGCVVDTPIVGRGARVRWVEN